MKIINWIAFILVVVGALNWGLVGIADFNLVTTILGDGNATKVVYDLVGLSALYMIVKKGKLV
ncbi:MAG: hypothetical protein UV40_C0009G0010 [Parcubacteria group bacterium GW2011_GWA1_42_7]|nr:MAG: hypothetical protein UV34_C0026G0008 [Parcubacteria group bacterium GW2011_GWB1_42_6]KKS69964.1 MAG: hypothetical protein UV40_C0009G0010 [Parcubacteria group bacterium GW2011_GWA1_42_7]KKS91632.1 MAG: hypothetical protein UV67_C0023G0008 [Parcubacteria group bacterium GW2011_GWC1_43_12]